MRDRLFRTGSLAVLVAFGLVLAGCASQDKVTYVKVHVPYYSSEDRMKMENCEIALKNQQEENGLSPLCFCQWEWDDSRAGRLPHFTGEVAVQCNTCDPFQQGYHCGDYDTPIPPPSHDTD